MRWNRKAPVLIDTGAQGRTLDLLAVGTLARGNGISMGSSLLQLMEELLQSIEQRDAGDPDAPAWEAGARIQRLEEELARRLTEADAERGAGAVASAEGRGPEGALAGIA
jgi:hypothetical protein